MKSLSNAFHTLFGSLSGERIKSIPMEKIEEMEKPRETLWK